MNKKLALAATLLLCTLLVLHHFHTVNAYQQTDAPVLYTAQHQLPDSNHIGQSKIQVVFALDATGSMSGLIDAAKEKIWSIAGSMAQAEPAPVIEIGLLFYRDRGDAFVTRQVALSTDMDEVYGNLMQVSADGGGDSPESVNQALHEAVTEFTWDRSLQTYKTVFLVGDCPPHMDYANDITYPVSCTRAKQKDIVLNTILMGDDQTAKKVWMQIANCSQGSFTQVNMSANDIAVNTPYDSIVALLSDKLDGTRMYYGNEKEKSIASEKMSTSKYITGNTKANVKAQRAEYNFTKTGKDGYYGNKELLEAYRQKKVSIADIKQNELPEQMKQMTAAEKATFLQQQLARRDSLNKELMKFTKLRQEFIEQDLRKRKPEEVESSFTNQVYKSIQKQTEKKNIRLKDKAKY